jgi:hypothetical protein
MSAGFLARGSSPSACLPGLLQWLCWPWLAAHSCGRSRGLGTEIPHRVPYQFLAETDAATLATALTARNVREPNRGSSVGLAMSRPDFERFFRDYAELYNQALGDTPNYQAIMDCFADWFLAASPEGVKCGQNGAEFRAQLEQGYAFYKKIGTKRMTTRRVEPTEIDATHHLVKVFYRAEYQKKPGEPVTIDFDVSYLLESRNGHLRIFAFVAGDEMGAYRRAGLID